MAAPAETTLATTAEFASWQNRTGLTLTGSVAEALRFATREVQRLCGRRFLRSPTDGDADEERTFSGAGKAVLVIDDLLVCAAVTLDSEAMDSSCYQTIGLGAAPYLYLKRLSSSTVETIGGAYTDVSPSAWPAGTGNVVITGSWGYAATVPDDVIEATCILAAIRLKSQASWDNVDVKRTSVINVTIEYDSGGLDKKHQEAERKLREYVRIEPEPTLV